MQKGMATHSSILAWRIQWAISYNIYKTTQKCVSETERFCDSVVLITNYLSLLFCDSGGLRNFNFSGKKYAREMERSLSLGGGQEGLQDSTQFHKGTTGNKIGSNVD